MARSERIASYLRSFFFLLSVFFLLMNKVKIGQSFCIKYFTQPSNSHTYQNRSLFTDDFPKRD